MDDQTALVDLSPEQVRDALHQVRQRVLAATRDETQRIMVALATVINDRGLTEYVEDVTPLLEGLVPGFDVDEWRDRYGNLVVSPCSPYECCGWCVDCESCHGDGRDGVCDMGHCHECDHSCDR